jgi:hypothetical protein
MNIKTIFVHPPIPNRDFDWSAIDDETYDGPGSPIGQGPTEEAAIADLLEQLEVECPHCQWDHVSAPRLMKNPEAGMFLQCQACGWEEDIN